MHFELVIQLNYKHLFHKKLEFENVPEKIFLTDVF